MEQFIGKGEHLQWHAMMAYMFVKKCISLLFWLVAEIAELWMCPSSHDPIWEGSGSSLPSPTASNDGLDDMKKCRSQFKFWLASAMSTTRSNGRSEYWLHYSRYVCFNIMRNPLSSICATLSKFSAWVYQCVDISLAVPSHYPHEPWLNIMEDEYHLLIACSVYQVICEKCDDF